MANKQKKNIVASITDSIKDELNFALVQFENISHQSMESMRHDLKKAGAKLQVVKNTLFEKSVNQLSQTNSAYKKIRKESFPLKDKSALISFTGEWINGLKKYYEFSKDNDNLSFKLGVIDKVFFNHEGLTKLAQLPGKDQLMAQLIGIIKNPITKTTRALSSPMQKLVFVLSQKSKQTN
ncbi:MAG: 50S ribosomal protein L10 [Candidatus Roizmanbacteria bacterium GW2011_GWA2_37_7]|uniref:Large ribosomal subunit protein uL10 n=1 Tax=Candidatus Roizmanbacteria bacterium GW2011_GWA2_37_7 TaxID=1618481 RepID=A0A0G0H918_9BACT|nr:MAG: 50S ribosomal protein L10 [Candidatus Roizmanbacteria bacterium GW2011_GWA2_37_7]